MSETEGAATAAPETPSSSGFEETVLGLLGQMSEQFAALSARVDAVESKPQFIQPPLGANTAAADRSRQALAANPDGIPKSQKIPMFPNGQTVPEMVMNQYRPKFGSGSLVQLDLAAVPFGRTDGRTRGELMDEKGVPNGYGQVLDITYLSAHQGKGWKYRVKFDPKVMPGSNGGIVHLHEQELMPA